MRPYAIAALAAAAIVLLAAFAGTTALAPVTCDPAFYGALPDDGLDDTAGIQAAADNGCVVLREGAYILRRVAAKKASVVVSKPGTLFTGAGARRSILRMDGPGNNGDWAGVRVSCATVTVSPGVLACDPALDASDVELSDFGFDNALMYNTEEQTHAIQVGPGARDVRLSDLEFWHPIRFKPTGGVEGGGDCVRVAGVTGRPVEDVSVTSTRFRFCDRSGVAFQSPGARLLIADNVFERGTDNDVDGEITGAGDFTDVQIQRNRFRKGVPFAGSSNSAYAISLVAGSNAGMVRNVQILGNSLDRGIEFFDVDGVIVRDNVIRHVAPSVEATVEVRRSRGVQIVDNQVTRLGFAGPVLRCFYHNGVGSKVVTIRGGLLRQESDANVVIAESCDKLEILGPDIQYAGPAPSGSTGALARYGVRTRATIAAWPMTGLKLVDLVVAGALTDSAWSAPPLVPTLYTLRDVNPIAP